MTSNEYFLYALKNGLIYKLAWYYSVMAFLEKGKTENEYIGIRNNKYYVKIEDNLVEISNIKTSRPLLTMLDKIIITNETLANVNGAVDTIIGLVVFNKISLVDNFGSKIPYQNSQINISKIESIIAKSMHNTDIITVAEYIRFVDSVSFIHGLSRITTVSATERSILPPKGIDKFKAKLVTEFNIKYGERWTEDRSKIVEFEDALKEFDAIWMAGDATDGKMTSGKVKDTARSKMFLTFGAEAGFDKKGNNPNLVVESLMDGYPEDINKLTTMFNTSRSGSYDRGKETQKGGAAAKDVLRATSAITIEEGDCGTTIGKELLVTADIAESLIGRYMFTSTSNRDGKNYMPIKDTASLIGQTIEIRSPMFCKKEGSTFCTVCAGEVLSNYKTGISLLVTDISGILLNSSMKSMHSHTLKTMSFDITEAIH